VKSDKIWTIWKKGKLNCEKILKIRKKSKLNSEKIEKIWKKDKLNSENVAFFSLVHDVIKYFIFPYFFPVLFQTATFEMQRYLLF
jgi:hypothetical protein